MDDFSHITEELEVVEEGLKFRFNTARCVATDEEKVPKAKDFELLRVRRAYHFNKGSEDHVILTIPEPECLVLINKQLKSMQQVRTGSDAPCGRERKPGATAHEEAVKGLGCVVDDPTVEWVATPDEDCGTTGVEAQPSSIEVDVNNANFNKQIEQDENLSAVKESCSSFSPVKLNSSEIASGSSEHLAIKRKKSSKQRTSKRLKRKLNSSISPERKCNDMCKIEEALIVALKNSESCKSSEVNRLHNISTTKITRNAKKRSNINGDATDFKEKLKSTRINEVCKECTVKLEDISSILNATYRKPFNSRTDQIQEAEEASVCLKENLNSGEKPTELFLAQENLIRVEDNLYLGNISTKTHKNAEKVEVCCNITKGNSTLRRMLEAPLKSSKFNQNVATTTQHNVAHDKQSERFYKRANEQRAKQIEEESIPNSLTNIRKDSELNKDLTDGVYRKNNQMALHEVSQSEKNSNKIQHKLDFNNSTFHCDPGIIIKEEFNCFMEDHAFLQNETRPSLRNSDLKNETNEDNWIYGQQLFQKDQHTAQLEEYGKTAERVHKSEIIEEFEENYTNNSQTQQNSTEGASDIFSKSEESSGFADEEHEETCFASRNSRIQQNLTELVCEVEIFIPDDDDESESGYSQEHSQMDESNLQQEKMQNTDICRRGDIVTDKTRIQKNISCYIVTNDSKKLVAENDVAITLVYPHIDVSSLKENQHNCDPSEDVRTCDDEVATTEITIKDIYTHDCSQTNANSSAGSVESQERIQEQVSFDPSSCISSEDTHTCNDELANMQTSSSEDIHKIQENLESRDVDCDSREIQHCDQNTHCIQADAEDAQTLQENREFPKKVSWGAQNCDKNSSDDAEETFALEHSQMDADTSEDSHRIENIVEAPGEINLDCRRTEDQDCSDSHEGIGACTITHLQTDTNSSEDKLQPSVATLNVGNILEQNNGNGLKSDCVSELSPMSAISSEDARQSQENHKSPIRSVRNENNIHDHDTCDSNKAKTFAIEFSLINSHSTEDANIVQDSSVPPVEVAWDGKNVLEQNSCDTNGDKSVCVLQPSPTLMIVSDDVHPSQENFEPPVEVARDGRNILKQNICDANGDKGVCVREPSPTPMMVSEDAHQSQENFEPLVEVAQDRRNIYEQNSCDANGSKSIYVCQPSPMLTIVSEDTHQSQENVELPLEVAQDKRNVHEQNSCDVNRDKSICVREPSPAPTIVSEDAHQSQENFEPLVEVARDGRNIYEQNSYDANGGESVYVRQPPMPMIVSEDTLQTQENFELPLEVAQDGRNAQEQNSCDSNRDKSVCVRDPSPEPTIVSEDTHQSHENFDLPLEVAQDGNNVHWQNSYDVNRDKSVCVRELSPAPTIISEDAHQSQENFEPLIEVTRDGRNVFEQNSCDGNGEGAHKSQGNLEPPVEVAGDGRNILEQNSCEAKGEGAHKSQINFEPLVEIARDRRNILEQNSCDANGEGAHKLQGNFEPLVEVARDGRNIPEQNSCDANRDESVCVHEHSPAPTIVSEDAHQSQGNFEPPAEVPRDERNILKQNSCEANEEGAHKSQGNFEPPVEVAGDGRNVLEQSNCDANRDKSGCVRELSPALTIVSEDAHQSQENLEPLVEVARDGRDIPERNSCDANGEGAHKSRGNLEAPEAVARDRRNVFEQSACDANRDKSVCVRELSPALTIISEDAHQSQENLEPLVEVARDGRDIVEQNSCEANGEPAHKSQGSFEPSIEVAREGRNVLEQKSYDVISYKSVCIHEPALVSIILSEDARQSQETLSPREVVQDGRETRDRNTCNVGENTCARKDSEMYISTLEDVHKLQENLAPLLEVTCDGRNVEERNSCEGDEGENTCTRKHSGMDIHSLEDIHKLQKSLGSLLEVTWDEREAQKQNNCDCNEDKCACAMELSPVGSSSSEDANKPEENIEVPIEVASDEKQIHKQNSCDDNEVKSACALEFSQMDTSFAEDKEECRESEKKVDWDDNEDKSAFKFSQMDMSSAEDVRRLQENLEPVEKVDLNETKMQQSNLNQSKYNDNEDKCACALKFSQFDTDSSEDARKLQENLDLLEESDLDGSNMQQSNCDDNEDKSTCAVELLHMNTSSSVDVNELQENLESLDYRKIKDNKNESACVLECSLKISTSSEATNKIETNFEPQAIMGFDEENIPAYIVTKIHHDFVGFSDEESKTPLLNLILTDDLCANEDKSGDLCKTEDSCKFSSNASEFYEFSTKRIKLIEENLSYICNKHHSLYKQYDFDEKPIVKRKNAQEVLNSRNLTEIVDHDYIKNYRNVQSNFMVNREQGTQTLATKEDFANKTNDKPVCNREGQQVEEMEQLLEELIQEHIKSFFAQDGIDEEMATDQEKNDIKVEEEKENKGPRDHPNNSEEVPEVSQNKKNCSDLKPAATPKHTQVFEYNTELSNDSIISERQLEADHGDNDKKSSDIFMEVKNKNGKLFKCNQCNFKVNKENHLKIHSRVHILSCWCNICPETFADTTALQKHVKVSHSCHVKAQRTVMNNSGEKPFQLSSDTPSHISSNEPSQASSKNPYKCGYCNYTTSYINRLRFHKRVHKEKLYKCGKCSFTTLREWKLKRHDQNVHSSKEELRECDECGFISIYQHEWDMHVQLHSGKKLYQCDMCSFSTAHEGYFSAHRVVHLSSQVKKEEPDEPEDRLRCEECDYRTDLHSSLLRHGKKFGHRVASHPSLSQSRLVCSECNYVANSYVTLKQHLMTHIDLKPSHLKDNLVCSKCKKVCLTHKDLKRHMNKEHPGIA